MAEENKWFLSPQGWVAVIAIASTFLGGFYIRERQLWEHGTKLIAIEARGDAAIASMNARFERMEQVLSENRDRLNFLERKIDHLEFDVKELKDARSKGQQPYQ
jgi:hypothetical protein